MSNPTTPLSTWDQQQDATEQPFQVQDTSIASGYQGPSHPHIQQRMHQIPQTIPLEERPSPMQYRFDNTTVDHFRYQQPATTSDGSGGRRGSSRAPSRPSVSPSTPSTCGPGPSTMPVRNSRGRVQTHPYARPQSATITGSGQQSPVGRLRPVQNEPTPTNAHAGTQLSLSANEIIAASGTTSSSGSTVMCPLMNMWRARMLVQNVLRGGENVSPDTTTIDWRRWYKIRTDVQLKTDNTLVYALQLPGVEKADVTPILTTCPVNKTKVIVVVGIMRPYLRQESGEVVGREHIVGLYWRCISVPQHIEREDINMKMDKGMLTLMFPAGQRVQARPQVIPFS
ncbi:uncharacterized protein FIBRA_03278 [Fibroporia radiculosa]|uniref:Uncharacterized protein n=1 Tax=Fibroporia radiculosa TaxID=599839 RepID=J4GNE1_9APHY|nr:uncharacterized protein FIBRA_03278 [Fibroporia radiculosa]CCM01230.1 predicted protein [Fibroporia radiculosa]